MGGGAKSYSRPVSQGRKWYPEDFIGGLIPMTGRQGKYHFVDGDKAGDGSGVSWDTAFKLTQSAIDAASAGDVIFISERTITEAATDPISYEENLTIPNAKSNLSLIGISRGRTQGGLPQLKDGTTTTQEILRIRAPGCLIMNLGFNGAGNTGGGILLDESVSGYNAWGTTIANCHFKNCKGATATDSRTGGAIMWTSNGGAWQIRITGNKFYKNVGDIILKATSSSKPQDILIDNNYFSPVGANTDCNIYGAGGSGFAWVDIDNNRFGGLPALGSGSVVRYMDLTGCAGMVSDNKFGCYINATATELEFGAAGTAAKVPAEVWMANNWGNSNTVGETAEIIHIA